MSDIVVSDTILNKNKNEDNFGGQDRVIPDNFDSIDPSIVPTNSKQTTSTATATTNTRDITDSTNNRDSKTALATNDELPQIIDCNDTTQTQTMKSMIPENEEIEEIMDNSDFKGSNILGFLINLGTNLVNIATMIQYETQQVSKPNYESSFTISKHLSNRFDSQIIKYKESNSRYQRFIGNFFDYLRYFVKMIINFGDNLDKSMSDVIHKLECGIFDYIILIPGTVFGVFGVPVLAILEWRWQHIQQISNNTNLNDYSGINSLRNAGFLFSHNHNFRYIYSVLLTVTLSEIMKYSIGRIRPAPNNIGKKRLNLRKMHDSGSMPSGDTAQASVAAVTLLKHGYSPLFCWSLIPFGAFGRVYFGSHYIGDCVVGAALGWISTMFVDYLCDN